VIAAIPGLLRDMDTPADYERELTEYLSQHQTVPETMEV